MIDRLQALSQHAGARWIKADLHVHTPASHDFKWTGLNRQTFGPQDYVAAMQAIELDLVAIADHSTAAWVDEMKRAARDLKKLRRLGVLPAVEVSVGGIHLVLIFPEEFGQNHLAFILSKLDIAPDDRGKRDTVCTTKSVVEVIQIVHDQHGMVIGAHCMSDRTGIVQALKGQTRAQALELIDAVELKPGQDPSALRLRLSELVHRQIPIILSSDAHHISELHPDVTYLKMGCTTFRGFSQIKYEPQGRIALAVPVAPTHPRIIGFQVSQGLLGEVPVRFSPYLNTLIGGRGTGKSAVLDLLRFGLGLGARIEENESTFRRRIKSFVGPGGVVSVYFQDGRGGTYCAERRGDYTETRRGGLPVLTFSSDPKLFRLIDGRFIPVPDSPLAVMPVEFFGQGEVMELSKKADDQLALIDEHIDFGELKCQEATAMVSLEATLQEVIDAEEFLEDLNQKVEFKQQLEARVEELDCELRNPVFLERTLWEKERAFLVWGRERISSLSALAGRPVPTLPAAPTLNHGTPNRSTTEQVTEVIDELAATMARLFEEFQQAVATARQRFEKLEENWTQLDEENAEIFRQALRQAGGLGLQALHHERSDKEEQLRRIREEYEPLLNQQRHQVEKLHAMRKETVKRLVTAREVIHRSRKAQLDAMQDRLGAVRVTVTANGDRRGYFEHLRTLYHGSRIQNLEAQLERVVDRLLPHELAALLLEGDEASLVAKTGVTAVTANKLVAHPSRDAKMELQSWAVRDRPTVSLKRAGEDAYTPLDQLSDGERCSAILSIALLEKNRPLLIDQPEDELDHQYVIDNIVANIKAIKRDRQLIIATHDPNIPVLGDAELVFRVTKEPGVAHCHFLAEGALEQEAVLDAVMDLEGGPQAFEQRRRKYMLA